MLKVRAIRKYHDAKGILIGYTIQDETGKTMDVLKDALKNAVISGQCEVVNMTLTSDGRLIGKACPVPKKRQPQRVGMMLADVYTNGKHVVGGLVNDDEYCKAHGLTHASLSNVKPGFSFRNGFAIVEGTKKKAFDNVKVGEAGSIDYKASGIRKVSFSKVREKLVKIIKETGVVPEFNVEKADKNDYNIIVVNSNSYSEDIMTVLYMLVHDCMATDKIKVNSMSCGVIQVFNQTGIADVRKALKPLVAAIKK